MGTAHRFHAPWAQKNKQRCRLPFSSSLSPYQAAQEQSEKLRAPALRGCAKPHSHNSFPHRKGWTRPSRSICHPPAYNRLSPWPPTAILLPFLFVRVALGWRSCFPDLSWSQQTWVRALLPCLLQCTHSACECASFTASHTLGAEEESWPWHLLCRPSRCALKGNCFRAMGTTLSGLR